MPTKKEQRDLFGKIYEPPKHTKIFIFGKHFQFNSFIKNVLYLRARRQQQKLLDYIKEPRTLLKVYNH